MSNEIVFCKLKDPYGEFSNFAAFGFTDEFGRYWKTSEHYYQAHKTFNEEQFNAIKDSPGPWACAKMGRDTSLEFREDWDTAKFDVMRRALYLKFTQNKKCFMSLVLSGDSTIVEFSKEDTFWGRNEFGVGENWLGKLLMELRTKLRAEMVEFLDIQESLEN